MLSLPPSCPTWTKITSTVLSSSSDQASQIPLNFQSVALTQQTVIQGHVDVGKRLTDDELQKTLDFCGGVFEPVDAELRETVMARMDDKLLASDAPAMTAHEIEQAVGPTDLEARQVLKELNARKALGSDGRGFGSIGSWSDEIAGGFVVRTERGRLGLVRA